MFYSCPNILSLLFLFLSFYRGIYDIVVAGICVGQYNNKGSFGELALMYNTPRAATIIATQEGALWGLVRTYKWTIAWDVFKAFPNYELCWSHFWPKPSVLS